MSEHMTKRDAVAAAMSIAEDVTSGVLDLGQLESQVVATCRELVSQVVGEGDPLWPLQVEIARGVLATGGIGGIGADEQAEWLAVARRRETPAPLDAAGAISVESE